MLRLDVHIEDTRWDPYQNLFDEEISSLLNDALIFHGSQKKGRVGILLASNDKIQQLNKQFRDKDKPTNVLSFTPAPVTSRSRQTHYFGDIALAFETLETEATAQHKSLHHHIMHLTLHGFLHLLGFDHEEEDERHRMEVHEIILLAQHDISNPYEVS